MPTWTEAGLPRPQTPPYVFQDDAGLIRTPFDIGYLRQRQRYTTGWRTYTLEYWLTAAELKTAEDYVRDYGYKWYVTPLLNDATGEATCANMTGTVRVTANPEVTAQGADLFTFKLSVEEQPS